MLVPGCYDAMSAKLIQAAGFPAAYIGSYSTAASRFGVLHQVRGKYRRSARGR